MRVIPLSGRLDAATAPEAEAQLLAAIEPGAQVVADLADVHHLSPGGVAVLLKAAKAAAAAGATLAIAAPHPEVRGALEAAGLDRVLPIAPSADAAAGALG